MSLPFRIPRSAFKTPVKSFIKAWSVFFSDGTALSAHPDIFPLEFERDFPHIEKLLKLEQWPFVKNDLQASHQQPGSVGLVAHYKGQFAGFYLAHPFGKIGYLDMSIIAPEFRGKGVGRPLHVRAMREMKKTGIRSFVVHTTQESAPMIWLLGFDKGQSFSLMAREPLSSLPVELQAPIKKMGIKDLPALVELDEAVFGLRRETWIVSLLQQSSTEFYGIYDQETLVASLCLRSRRDGALCLDMVNGKNFEELQLLLHGILQAFANQRIECFVREQAPLWNFLQKAGFFIPDFFQEIGPLTEWRKGKTGKVGRTPLVQCLSWF